MNRNKNYTIVISLLSFALLIIILLSLPSPSAKDIGLEDFPEMVGQWQGENQPIDQKIYEMLPESDLLLRVYKNIKGDVISLFIVASSSNPEAFHPPELCLGGAGAQFLKKDTKNISFGKERIKVNKLYIKEKNREDLTLYWFRVGVKTTHSFYTHQLNMIFDQIMRKRSISAMIRVITTVKDGKVNEAFELEKGFIEEISPMIDKYLR
ncbi:MAG: exosortase C-terminal domain/associated protein EpsI [Nitrospirota bacterium]